MQLCVLLLIGFSITNDPKDVTVCGGSKAKISCAVSNPSITKPQWKIIKRSDDGHVISSKIFTEINIVNNVTDGLHWKESQNRHNKIFTLLIDRVDVSYNNAWYQCIFIIDGNVIESKVGTATVIGMYIVKLHMSLLRHIDVYN